MVFPPGSRDGNFELLLSPDKVDISNGMVRNIYFPIQPSHMVASGGRHIKHFALLWLKCCSVAGVGHREEAYVPQ